MKNKSMLPNIVSEAMVGEAFGTVIQKYLSYSKNKIGLNQGAVLSILILVE
jgi:hypothetical protein